MPESSVHPAYALTPPELARRWRVKPDKIIGVIRRGELRAFDVSSRPGVGRPRFRISLDAVIEFEAGRSARAPVGTRSRRRRRDASVISFF